MYQTSDFKKGLKILIDDQPYAVVDFQHVKPGKGNQFTRTKLKNMITGSNLERTFKSGEKFGVPDVASKTMNFLYKDDAGFHFMDQTSYEQLDLSAEEVGETRLYLKEDLQVDVVLFNDRPIAVEVANTVVLKVAQTDPGLKGNTVTGGSKPASMESGLVVQVPLHINEDDQLRIDSRTGNYLERVNKT